MNFLGGLELVDSVADFGSSPELDGAFDTTTATINGVTYVYVSGRNDSGVQVLSLANDGTMEPVMAVPQSSALGISSPARLETMQIGDEFFLAVTATSSNAITMFRLDDDGDGTDGHLVHVATYRNAPQTGESTEATGLLSFSAYLEVFEKGNNTFIAATGYNSDSIALFQVAGNGELTRTDSILDGDAPDLRLNGASGVESYTFGNRTILYVGSDVDNGLSSFQVSQNGNLTFRSELEVGTYPQNMTIAEFGGVPYLFYTDQNNSLYVIGIEASGEMTLISETERFIDGRFSDLSDMVAAEIDGVPYLFVGARSQDFLLVLTLDENLDLQIVEEITVPEIDGIGGITIERKGSKYYAVVAAASEDAVTTIEIGGGDDPIVGSMESDMIVGLDGDDDILGLAGRDLLIGGNGNDVLSGRINDDTLIGGAGDDVLVGGLGRDRLEGGRGADIMKGGDGRDVLDYSSSGNGVDIDLTAGTASGGQAEGDIFVEIESVEGSRGGDLLNGDGDRNWLKGNGGDDTISGSRGNDTLIGDGGDDELSGGGGRDRLVGGDGEDMLSGGDLGDSMFGGNNADTLEGGRGNDTLDGGSGADVLRGNASNDRLIGLRGNDTLDGGTGDDTMTGGAQADTFILRAGDGSDRINDFDVSADILDVTAIASISSLADFRSAAIEVGNDTLLVIDGGPDAVLLVGRSENEFTADNFLF